MFAIKKQTNFYYRTILTLPTNFTKVIQKVPIFPYLVSPVFNIFHWYGIYSTINKLILVIN